MNNLFSEMGLSLTAPFKNRRIDLPKARLTTFALRYLMVALVSVVVVASCSAQLLLATAATPDRSLTIPANIDPSVSSADLTLATSVSQPVQPPDAPSAVQATINFNATRIGLEAPMYDAMQACGQNSYDQASAASSPGKLIRMISGLVRRFDQSDLTPAQGIRENPGLSGDTSFAVSRRLALIGAYQHNSVPSFDTMALGVAFNFGGNTNQPPSQ